MAIINRISFQGHARDPVSTEHSCTLSSINKAWQAAASHRAWKTLPSQAEDVRPSWDVGVREAMRILVNVCKVSRHDTERLAGIHLFDTANTA